jgi:hypothetical protein
VVYTHHLHIFDKLLAWRGPWTQAGQLAPNRMRNNGNAPSRPVVAAPRAQHGQHLGPLEHTTPLLKLRNAANRPGKPASLPRLGFACARHMHAACGCWYKGLQVAWGGVGWGAFPCAWHGTRTGGRHTGSASQTHQGSCQQQTGNISHHSLCLTAAHTEHTCTPNPPLAGLAGTTSRPVLGGAGPGHALCQQCSTVPSRQKVKGRQRDDGQTPLRGRQGRTPLQVMVHCMGVGAAHLPAGCRAGQLPAHSSRSRLMHKHSCCTRHLPQPHKKAT